MKDFCTTRKLKLHKFGQIFILVFLSSFLFLQSASAQNFPSIPLTENDRILIFSPHPDDETIGVGGVIQKAVQAKASVKIVYLTNGDSNELAFLVYEKRPILSRLGLLDMGELRRKESIAAMQFLGLDEKQLAFLGYPDCGTTDIFVKYWGDTVPFTSMLTRVSTVPYKDAFSPGASYKGESILRDLKKIIREFQPTKIFVTLPVDTNLDHRASFLFLQVALWDLEGQIPVPEIYPYVVHMAGWPKPRGFHADLNLTPPEQIKNAGIDWYSLNLTPQEIDKKKKALSYYKSQNAYNPRYLYTFVRRNELFGRFRDINLKSDIQSIDWRNEEPRQKVGSHLLDNEITGQKIIRSVTYAQKGNDLYVQLKVKNWPSKLSGISVFLIGYKKTIPFEDLPKIRVHINFDRFVTVYDQRVPISVENMQFTRKGDTLILRFPLSNLGFPNYILSSARTYITKWSLEATPWRTLIVDNHDIRQ